MQASQHTSARPSGPVLILAALGAGEGANVEKVRAFWRRVECYGPGAQVRAEPAPEKQLIIVPGWACDLRILPDVAADRAETGLEPVEPGDTAQHGALAAARRTEQRRDAARRNLELRVQLETAEPAAKVDGDGRMGHEASRATLFSIKVIARITLKEKMIIPSASTEASVHCDVST